MSTPVTQDELNSAEWLLDGLGVDPTDARKQLVVSYRRQMQWLASSSSPASRFSWELINGAQYVKDNRTGKWLGPFDSVADARVAIRDLQKLETKR